MRTRNRRWTWTGTAGAVLALLVVAAACGKSGSGSSGSGGGGTIKIGVPGPLSGPYATAGVDIVNGAKLAVSDANAKGGALGKRFEIVQADDACDAQTAAQAAQKLIVSGVVAVAGGYCSSAALPELTAFHRKHLAYVMDASTNPQLTEMGIPEAFRTIGRDDHQGPVAASFIANFLHAKKAAVIHDNTTYAKGLGDSVVENLKTDGVDVVYFDAITPGQQDYTPTLTKVISLKPDVIEFTGYFAEAGLIVKQARQLGYSGIMMAGDANNDPTLIKTAGSASEGMVITTAPLAQFLSGTQSYVTDYQKQFGQAPGPYSVYEYDAVRVVAQAIADAKSTDPAKIVAALRAIKGYPGLTGPVGFDAKGDRVGINYMTITVKNGAFVAYKKLDAGGNWVDAAA
jgi:branched-chain amino acid transport system substrate-binding protein